MGESFIEFGEIINLFGTNITTLKANKFLNYIY